MIAAGLGWPQRAQVPDAGLGRVCEDVAGGDGIHGAAPTEAGGGDGRSGAEMQNGAAQTQARGGGGGWAEIRDQAEHVISVGVLKVGWSWSWARIGVVEINCDWLT